MKCLVITGGSISNPFAKKYIEERCWDYVISADAGMRFCKEINLMPDVIIGDFDSVDADAYTFYQQECPERIIVYPVEKDETDTELAMMKAIEVGAHEITVLGATGTRLDHVLGNIQLLKMTMDAGIACFLVDEHNRIRMISEEIVLKKEELFGHYVSLIPFTPEVTGLTLTGFFYEVEDFTLRSGKARGISNEVVVSEASIQIRDGILLVIESQD